jgi:hypothetical protein
MSISNETLMAYVDGELDPAARTEVEAAMLRDAEIERRVDEYRKLREKLKAAYEPVLAEPVPERLLAVLRAGTRGDAGAGESAGGEAGAGGLSAAGARPADAERVIDFPLARPEPHGQRSRPRSLNRQWRYPASVAAGILVAVGVAIFAWERTQPGLVENRGGSPAASGVLAHDLSERLAGDSAPDGVRIGISFLARNGEYCRTFSVTGREASAGIACRTPQRWEIRQWAPAAESSGAQGDYRTAGSSLPPSLLAAVQARIAGDPLDRDGEIRARQNGWQAR